MAKKRNLKLEHGQKQDGKRVVGQVGQVTFVRYSQQASTKRGKALFAGSALIFGKPSRSTKKSKGSSATKDSQQKPQ